MLPLNQALNIVKKQFNEIYPGQTDFRLEEVDFDSSNYCNLTVSILLPDLNPPIGIGTFSHAKKYIRLYKKVILNKAEANIESIKNIDAN
jgi:hypothetical protein